MIKKIIMPSWFLNKSFSFLYNKKEIKICVLLFLFSLTGLSVMSQATLYKETNFDELQAFTTSNGKLL